MTTADDPTPPQATAHPERRLFVQISIAAVALLFVAAVGLLFWRSYTSGEPNALWVIEGDASLDGAVVTVEGVDTMPISRALTAKDNYIARIPVPPDVYSIRVVHKGKVVYHNSAAKVGSGQYGLVSKDHLHAATQPAETRR